MKRAMHRCLQDLLSTLCGVTTALAVFGLLIPPAALQAWAAPASSGNSSPAHKSPPVPAETAASAASTQSNQDAAMATLNRLARVAENLLPHIPRDTFEPKAIVKKVGSEPEALFQWVRDHTYWVPYRGVLRGDKGVLMDRVGNSLDRSLLLAKLLQEAGHEVRLAHGPAPRELVQKWAAKRSPVPAQHRRVPNAAQVWADKTAPAAQALGFTTSQLEAARARGQLHRTDFLEEVIQTAVTQSEALFAQLGDTIAFDTRDRHQRALEVLRDHWWVQVKREARWVSADPLFPETAWGKRWFEPAETLAPDALKDELFHRVRLRVVAEQWKGGKVSEAVPLETVLRAHRMVGLHARLRFVPLDWPSREQLFSGEPEEVGSRLKEAALRQNEWQPVLHIGKSTVQQGSVTANGAVNEKPTKGNTGRKFQKALKAFGGEEDGEGELTALWIEYQTLEPGREPQIVRRAVLNLLGPADRIGGAPTQTELNESQQLQRALTMLSTLDLLVLPCQISPAFIEERSLRHIAQNRTAAMGAMYEARERNLKAAAQQLGRLDPMPNELYALARARAQFGPLREHACIARPNILTFRHQVTTGPKARLILREGYDIVANDVINVAEGGSSLPLPLRQGVVDTVLESKLQAASEVGLNAAELYARSLTAGQQWRTVRSLNDPEWQSIVLPANVRNRIQRDLEQGYVVVVPQEPMMIDGAPRTGWWRIDPASGQALGFNATGWGAAAAEYSMLITTVAAIFIILGTMRFAKCFHGQHEGNDADLTMCIVCSVSTILFAAAALAITFLTDGVGIPIAAMIMDGLTQIGCEAYFW